MTGVTLELGVCERERKGIGEEEEEEEEEENRESRCHIGVVLLDEFVVFGLNFIGKYVNFCAN
jgi:hypothetical protein